MTADPCIILLAVCTHNPPSQQVQVCACVVAELYLFGHSSGGCAVLAAALKLGDRVKGLYIYEPINVDPETMRYAYSSVLGGQGRMG